MSTNTPEPAHSPIPIGLGTLLGLVGSILLACATAISTVLEGNHQDDTTLFAILAGVVTVATLLGRMAQAIAEILRTGNNTIEPPPETPALTPGADEPAPVDRDPALEPGQDEFDVGDIDMAHEQSDMHEADDAIAKGGE